MDLSISHVDRTHREDFISGSLKAAMSVTDLDKRMATTFHKDLKAITSLANAHASMLTPTKALIPHDFISGSLKAAMSVTDLDKRMATTFHKDLKAITGRLALGDEIRELLDVDRIHPDIRFIESELLAAMLVVTQQEGIPVIGVVPREVEDELLYASDAPERSRILALRKEEILTHCLSRLSYIQGELAHQCRNAVVALREGRYSAAQALAACVSDSTLIALYGRNGSQTAKEYARQDVMSLPLHQVRENLVLKPIDHAFTTWYPDQGLPMPDHFSRHATIHAVGHPGLFSEEKALIAVMLATSLTLLKTSN